MRTINKFYKLHLKGTPLENDFDIDELADETYRSSSPAIYSNKGKLAGGESIYTSTTQEDYDKNFIEKIRKIKPIYNIPEFLDYHYENFCSINEDKEIFLKQIQYVILPKLQKRDHSEICEIVNDWLNKCKNKLLKEQENDTINFLYRAYEEAQKAYPMAPFSARINPFVLGELLNFDHAKVKRIVTELNSEFYVDTTAGFADMMIKPKGLAYLRNYYNNVNSKQKFSTNATNPQGSNILVNNDKLNSEQNHKMKKKVFISYYNEDHKKMKMLAELIDQTTYLKSIVIAKRKDSLKPLTQKVTDGIHECDIFAPILTRDSITSQWVNQEIGYATANNKKIIPIIQHDIINDLKGFIHKQVDLPYTFQGNKILARSESLSFKKCVTELINDLKTPLSHDSLVQTT